MLAGLIDPDEGSVRVDGLEVKDHVEAVKDQIGYMAQRFGLYGDLSVEENMIFYRRPCSACRKATATA